MIGHIISHIIFKPIINCFLGIGGIVRWFFFQFINIILDKEYSKDPEYYINTKDDIIDKNGFTVSHKNMFVSFILFIVFLLIIEKIEK